ncbi:hypothetical protein PR048_028442 [Dryococelus australis]|uniref:Uncharacterized protein n=1 Tax=Dryococelus australis TaxID=614101 RepID=A0ABQ9GAK0_9NEOP|nr:hypothetical protein PR048_028442 [Dryococelus australis]
MDGQGQWSRRKSCHQVHAHHAADALLLIVREPTWRVTKTEELPPGTHSPGCTSTAARSARADESGELQCWYDAIASRRQQCTVCTTTHGHLSRARCTGVLCASIKIAVNIDRCCYFICKTKHGFIQTDEGPGVTVEQHVLCSLASYSLLYTECTCRPDPSSRATPLAYHSLSSCQHTTASSLLNAHPSCALLAGTHQYACVPEEQARYRLFTILCSTGHGATVAERLARSPPTKANRSPDFRKLEECRTMPLNGGFSRGSPVSPALSFRRRSIFIPITLTGSQDLAVKGRPNLLTHSTGRHQPIICKSLYHHTNHTIHVNPSIHQGEPGSIPSRVTGFSQVIIVPAQAIVLRGSPFFPAPLFRCCSILTPITLIGLQDLAESRPNIFTHSLAKRQLGSDAITKVQLHSCLHSLTKRLRRVSTHSTQTNSEGVSKQKNNEKQNQVSVGNGNRDRTTPALLSQNARDKTSMRECPLPDSRGPNLVHFKPQVRWSQHPLTQLATLLRIV